MSKQKQLIQADEIGEYFVSGLVSCRIGEAWGIASCRDYRGERLQDGQVDPIAMPWDDGEIGFELDVDDRGNSFTAFIGNSGGDWGVYVDGCHTHLGHFPSKEEAYEAAEQYMAMAVGRPVDEPDPIGGDADPRFA